MLIILINKTKKKFNLKDESKKGKGENFSKKKKIFLARFKALGFGNFCEANDFPGFHLFIARIADVQKIEAKLICRTPSEL